MPDTETLLAAMQARTGDLRTLGYRIRFDLTDHGEAILLDATGPTATVAPATEADTADCVLGLTSANLEKLMAGKLSPMLAFSTGRLKVEGSKGVALKLASLLDDA